MSEEKTYTLRELQKAYDSAGPWIDASPWKEVIEKLQNPEPFKFECKATWTKDQYGQVHVHSLEPEIKTITHNYDLVGKKGKLTFTEGDKK